MQVLVWVVPSTAVAAESFYPDLRGLGRALLLQLGLLNIPLTRPDRLEDLQFVWIHEDCKIAPLRLLCQIVLSSIVSVLRECSPEGDCPWEDCPSRSDL